MEIVLSNEDISNLIKSTYNGIIEVKYNVKNIKATLEVNMKEFMVKPKISPGPLINTKEVNKNATTITGKLPPEERFKKEIKKGLMASGGKERIMSSM